MAERPTGTVTFLFSDIEGSTRLLGQLGDRYKEILEAHQRLLRTAFEPCEGVEVRTEGDSFFVVFPRAPLAVAAAVAGQRALAHHSWPEDGVVRVRMGLHTGEGVLGGDDYVGIDVHRAARIGAAGHGGQILISETTRALCSENLPDGVTLKDLSEHVLKDLPQPEHLFQVDIQGLPTQFPPVRSLEAKPGNLPAQLTTFVGREDDIEAVKGLLTLNRLVTLTGPGGTGKTRLSLRVADESQPSFEDGAYFVRLAPIRDPNLVIPTITTTLGLREDSAQRSFDTLAAHLDGKSVLLVLDNLEQVISAAPDIGELLGATERVRIICTSREALRVAGEQEYPVPPLSLPDPAHLPPLEALTQYEAVALFIERANAVRPGFAVTNENAPAVAEITTRLDGLPLAIELAAARVKILTPEAILARLGDRLSLLAGGPRDLDARQQTLRDAIAWSFDLLDETEQRLFARLAVFMGGFSIEAAEAVCPRRELGVDVLDGIASLVNKSLLRQMELDHPEPRFVMLETIREYAAERLADAADAEEIRRRHAEFFLNLAEQAAPELTGANQASWLDTLEHEHNNFRSALEWAEGGEQIETVLRTGGALWRFWQMRGYLREARERLTQMLEISASSKHPEARAGALEAAGGVTYWMGDFEAAKGFYEECLELRRQLGDKKAVAEALFNLSFAFTVAPPDAGRDIPRGTAILEESLALFRELDDRSGLSRGLWGLANARREAGELVLAREAVLEALSMHRELGDRFSEAWDLHQLGIIALDFREVEQAREWCQQALEIFAEAGDLSGIALVLADFAGLAFGNGDPERAARLFGAATEIEAKAGTGLVASSAATERWLEEIEQTLEDPRMQRAQEEGRALSVHEAVAYALKGK
ncbi:MAG: ATP-binding protein [Actinomycetota bacterium]